MKLTIISFVNVINSFFPQFMNLYSWDFIFSNTSLPFLFFFTNPTSWFAIKFLFVIAFLILIRGGTPRYRYDYLTKLGWLKFLTLVVWFFLTLNVLYFLI